MHVSIIMNIMGHKKPREIIQIAIYSDDFIISWISTPDHTEDQVTYQDLGQDQIVKGFFLHFSLNITGRFHVSHAIKLNNSFESVLLEEYRKILGAIQLPLDSETHDFSPLLAGACTHLVSSDLFPRQHTEVFPDDIHLQIERTQAL